MRFTIRPAQPEDVEPMAALIRARCDWMDEHGIPSWREQADELAGFATNQGGDVWTLATDDGRIVGMTTVQMQGPPWGWTPEENAESAYHLSTTVTDPRFREHKPGTLIALWAVDKAARDNITWVRRGCHFPGLVRYYESQGFALIHTASPETKRTYFLARKAERIPDLAGRLTTA